MSHEQSETEERDGQWVNVYGKNTERGGEPLPDTRPWATKENAVGAAEDRSRLTLETRGVFDEQGGGWGAFARAQMPRDFGAERRPLIEQRDKNFAAQRATVSAAQAETEKQASDAEADSARHAAERKGADPGRTTLPATPSGEARPFLTPGPSVMSQLQALVLGVQQVGMQVAGLKGSAIAATAAIQGMATGWQKGDAERVQGEYKKWKVESERLIAQHADAVDAYKRLVEDQKLSTEQKRVLGTLRLKGYDWQAAQQAIESMDIAAQLKEVDASQARHDSLVEKAREFDEKLAENRRHTDIWAGIQRDNRLERAREADQRHAMAIRKFQASSAQSGPDFTPEALEMYANVVANGGAQPALGWGKASTEARIKIANRAAEIRKQRGDEPGSLLLAQQSQQANLAELKKIQTQRGPMLAFAATAEKNLDLALKLSDTVDREQYPAFNKWLLSGELKWAGDPSVAAFAAATRVAINETAKVTNSATGGGVSTDTARREIEDMLSTALNAEQFRSVAGVLKTDMHNRIKGYDEQIGATKAAISGGGAGPSETRIRVKRKSDGTPGTIDPKDFDAAKYERVGG